MWLLQLKTLFVIALVFQQVQPQATDSPESTSPVEPITEIPNTTPFAPIPTPKITYCNCYANDAILSWVLNGNTANIDYTIEYSTTITPDEWKVADSKITATSRKVSFKYPGATFAFRVIATDKNGRSSEPSEPSKMCSSDPDVPYENPKDVHVKAGGVGTIIVSWTPMEQLEHNGPGFLYRVCYRVKGDSDWIVEDITNWEQDKFVMQDLDFEDWQIMVKAGNVKGFSKNKAVRVDGYPGIDRPYRAPSKFSVTGFEDIDIYQDLASVTLKWESLPIQDFNGKTKGYKIHVWDGKSESYDKSVEYSSNQLTITLPFDSFYNATIQAVNERFLGPTSKVIQIRIPNGIPQQVEKSEAFGMGSSAIRLEWTKPNIINGQLLGYNVYYENIDDETSQQFKLSIENPSATTTKLMDLKPSTIYRIHVSAKTEAGEGKDKYIEFKTKTPQKPDVPSFTWKFTCCGLRVNWMPKLDGKPGSKCYAKYRVTGTENWEETAKTYDEFIVIGLEKDVLYEMTVVSVDDIHETESEIQQISGKIPEKAEFFHFSTQNIVIIAVTVLMLLGIVTIFVNGCLFKKCCPNIC